MHRNSTETTGYAHCPSPEGSLHSPFSLLCWNVNKRREISRYRERFKSLDKRWNFQLILLQEAPLHLLSDLFNTNYHICEQANLHFGKSRYGVATISRHAPLKVSTGTSQAKEFFVGPKKSYVLTLHSLGNGDKLLCLNLHAINFREHTGYRNELELLYTHLKKHIGPMIVAGDFNRWNKAREIALNQFCDQLQLICVKHDEKGVKKFMGHPLDFVYYRGLKVIKSEVIVEEISDHNPILVEFNKTNE
ncbi:endonuclease/exonuclease/phosphatase family protein [Nitratifractor sp.]